jgi:HSP20 family protein
MEIDMPDEAAKPAAADGKTAPAPAYGLAQVLSTLHNDVNHLFSRFLTGAPFQPTAGTSHPHWLDIGFASPAVDVTEDDEAFRVAVELPGVAPGDIELSIIGSTLVLTGEKPEQAIEKGRIVHIFERNYGAFRRSIHIPDSIDRESVDARFDKGVLMVTLTKVAQTVSRPTKIAVKIA